jgi:hypothetical protein
MRHGSKYCYNKGCRCARCREAQRVSRKAARDRARALNSPSYQRELAASRALKETYRGVCEGCGKPTTGCDGPGTARQLCLRCTAQARGLKQRGSGPLVAAALAYLQGGDRRYKEIATHLGISNGYMSALADRMLKYGLVERPARGVYRKVTA